MIQGNQVRNAIFYNYCRNIVFSKFDWLSTAASVDRVCWSMEKNKGKPKVVGEKTTDNKVPHQLR